MTMWDYLDAHPVWGLLYLVIVVIGFLAGTAAFVDARKKRTAAENLKEVIKAVGEVASEIKMEDRTKG